VKGRQHPLPLQVALGRGGNLEEEGEEGKKELLGDANIRLPSKNGNPQIQFKQGFIHLNYILYVFQILSPIVTHLPLLVKNRDLSMYLLLYTRCLACLFPLYDLFIVDGKKIFFKIILVDSSITSLNFNFLTERWMMEVERQKVFI